VTGTATTAHAAAPTPRGPVGGCGAGFELFSVVFVGVPLPGVPLTGTPQLDGAGEALTDAVMLVGHPCSMVSGAPVAFESAG
jgi:hypothetical protein